jgi:hypothetical protein
MSKWLRFRRKGLIFGVACGLAMLAFEGGEARAGIDITMSVGGGPPVDLILFTTPLVTDPGQLNTYGTVDLTLLNTFLTGAGSAYQFTSLGGSSNWAGAPTGGTLSLTGGIVIPAGVVGIPGLTLTETESGFTSPSGITGTLKSTSQGNYSDAGPPNSHDAQSSFNAITTSLYTVASTSTGPDHEQNSASAAIPAFVTPYALNNFISFSLAPSATSSPTDNFNVVAGVTSAIPEPASVVTMMLGMPLSLVCMAWLRRRRVPGRA